jgi:hypothetical protein
MDAYFDAFLALTFIGAFIAFMLLMYRTLRNGVGLGRDADEESNR